MLLALLMVVPSAATDPAYPAAAWLSPAPIATGQDADATAELQALIDRTPDGGEVRLSGGRYRIEGTLVVEERRDLTIDGNGSTLFATTTGTLKRSHLRVVGGRDIVVHDLTIIGANPHAGLDERAYQPTLEGQHGIRLEGVTDIELDARPGAGRLRRLRLRRATGVGRALLGRRVDPRVDLRSERASGHRRDRRP